MAKVIIASVILENIPIIVLFGAYILVIVLSFFVTFLVNASTFKTIWFILEEGPIFLEPTAELPLVVDNEVVISDTAVTEEKENTCPDGICNDVNIASKQRKNFMKLFVDFAYFS